MKLVITIAALFVAAFTSQASTNAMSELPPITNAPTVTLPNLAASVPDGVKKVAADGYGVFKNFNLTNPISIGIVGLKNGTVGYGGGITANAINPNSSISAGFGLFAIQTQTTDATTGKKTTGLNFYDATFNLSASGVWNLPILNVPLITRIFSGPFASLNGGVLVGEQSGFTGDFSFDITPKFNVDLGGGVVNCAGAAAAGLKPAMPMAHLNFTFIF